MVPYVYSRPNYPIVGLPLPIALESDNLGRALEVVTYLMADPTGINRESEPN